MSAIFKKALGLGIFILIGYLLVKYLVFNLLPIQINSISKQVGDKLDSLNGVFVYNNGLNYSQSYGKHFHQDGYYFGQKWQCVEFVKRYYYLRFRHKMPNVYGHAISFFNPQIKQGQLNQERNLIQYKNGYTEPPKPEDLIVFKYTRYGHVAIVSKISSQEIEIIQQNTGSGTRAKLPLKVENGCFFVGNEQTLGWLRK
jgi:surface antigen